MKPSRRNVLIGCAIALAAGVIVATTPGGGSLTVQIAPEGGRTEILPFLPVCVTISVANSSATTVTARSVVPETNPLWSGGRGPIVLTPKPTPPEPFPPAMYQFVITRPEGKSVRAMFADFTWLAFLGGYTPTHPGKMGKRAVGPGETWVQDYCLGYGMTFDGTTTAVGSLFDVPGEYTVRLEMPYLVEGGAQSNEITIRVKEPESESDRKACEMVRSSPFGTVFLVPPPESYGSPFVKDLIYPINTGAAELAARVLVECPGSAYAPYAELLVGKALTLRSVETGISARPFGPDVEMNAEGYRILRQCAENENLPRRYREAALVRLKGGAAGLVSSLQHRASESAPTIESILGEPVPDVGIPWDLVFRVVSDIETGKAPPGYEEGLRSKLTPEQYEALRNAVLTNSALATSAGVNPLQEELRGFSEWAGQELRKLPWRDPNTGELSLR